MNGFAALDLARLQFAFTISFHIIFPAFSIGLASFLAVLEGLWLVTGRDTFMRVFRYWVKIFAVTFGMGVVSGVVMSYQFGTNWSVFSDITGPIVGPLMGYEVLTAFFLEAGFLGVMLFGMSRVGRGLHFLATVLVAFGTLLSAFWILAVNSWMQTPAGYAVNDTGQYVPADWWQVIFNPSFPYRLVHMTLAAYLTTSLVVGAVGAWHLLRDRQDPEARLMFSMAMWMALLVAPLQVVVGDQHGLNTFEHQPAKVAAMEGHYETRRGAPLYLFGWPDSEAAATRYAVSIPKAGSLILGHSLDAEVPGLGEWPREDWPNVPLVFWSFRVMVGIALLIVLLGVWGFAQRLRGRLYESAALHRFAVLLGPSGFVAVLAGWTVTEAGRQPYVVQGLLRTADAVSAVDAPAVGASLGAFIVVYTLVFGAGIYYILRLMRERPEAVPVPELEGGEPFRADVPAGDLPGTGLTGIGRRQRPSGPPAQRGGEA